MMSEHQRDALMSQVIENFHHSSRDADVVVVEGLVPTSEDSSAAGWNAELSRTLSAEVIFVLGCAGRTSDQLNQDLEYAASLYGGIDDPRLAGCILNRVTVRKDQRCDEICVQYATELRAARNQHFALIGCIPENRELTFCRTCDIASHLGAEIVFAGQLRERRVEGISLLARTVPNMLNAFTPGAVLVTPSDRDDVIIAVVMAALNHVPIAGLVVTGDTPLDERVLKFCQTGFDTGLPLLKVHTNSYETATALNALSHEVPADDIPRITAAMDFAASHIDPNWLSAHRTSDAEPRLSPAAFCYRLTEQARRANKRILLPEGSEPRTIRAASICQQRGIARCVLLGNPDEIRRVASGLGVELPPELEILDADALRSGYVTPLYEMRKGKGLSEQAAADQLTDNVVLATVMLALGEADGLVSGAVHSTANTVRPALQLIKSKPGARVVSSIFFMCLPDQVVVYGDCALNTDPDAETLADIAIQSADSAQQFGITPRVAMISYSTGVSGAGVDVDKVREATRLARAKRPELLLDGPLQYDAAATMDVARTKAPDSPVAGRATVFIFPDLNTGNTTYKAVQRSANVVSIGPMLQGLKRPVNDLSRGALIEDIVYTIALTAVQADQG